MKSASALVYTNFEILDEGKPRPIAAFSVETRLRAEAARAAAAQSVESAATAFPAARL